MEWQPGDDALCIKGGIETVAGKIYKVRHVNWPGQQALSKDGSGLNAGKFPILRFTDWDPSSAGGCASRFVKVTPDTEDAFDREVIEALKSEPVHVPQHDALHNSSQPQVSGRPDAEQVRQ